RHALGDAYLELMRSITHHIPMAAITSEPGMTTNWRYLIESRIQKVAMSATAITANWPNSTPRLMPSRPTISEELEPSRVAMAPANPSPWMRPKAKTMSSRQWL